MYKILIAAALMVITVGNADAQKAKKKKKVVPKTATPAKDSSVVGASSSTTTTTTTTTQSSGGGLSGLLSGITGGSKSLSTLDISSGLKEALQVGVQNAASKLSSVNGFFGNAALKILMPPEAQKLENTLREYGMGKQVDDAILSMNRAAEDASKSAAPIFVNAIKGITITDAVGILKGSDTSATEYLKGKTTSQLTAAFSPVIQTSLDKVDATSYWTTLTSYYNKIPFVKKINTDLVAYVTDRALAGMFTSVGQEEQKIRKDPVAQTTDLLKKVFGGK
ncbi:DUF4197 domain-containing protein [Parasediminibacterium sp. JCM 36343]|uniref:DUF4197 domain-containing protein n=1 Tax=Parasediminibacterium sp. JCM 36343 TaxID=3374279 RepID=UPI00397AF49A